MDVNEFIGLRRGRWERLSRLLDEVDESGIDGITPQKTDELFSLYRLVSSDLNLAQTRTGNPALLEYLEALVARAYVNLAVPRRYRPLRSWWEIMRHRFPAAMRSERRALGIATLAMAAGVMFGFFATVFNTQAVDVFVSSFPEHLEQSPAQRVAELEEQERDGESRVDAAGHTAFTSMLFTHNIRVTAFCFALGFTFGVGTVVLLFFNGAILGSLAAWYYVDGVLTFFVAWVGPHGAVELPCILFGSTAGLMLARAQFRRDCGTVAGQIRRMRPRLVTIFIGTATLLVVAGMIEGGFSQINEPTIPYALKIAVAGSLLLALVFYLFFMRVKPDAAEEPTEAATA